MAENESLDNSLADLIKRFYSSISAYKYSETLSIMYDSHLTLPQIVTLIHVNSCKQCSISSISKRINLSLPATSQLVDKLVKEGFLIRNEDSSDRRNKIIMLTENGINFVKRLSESRRMDIENAISSLPVELKRNLFDALNKAISIFENVRGENTCED